MAKNLRLEIQGGSGNFVFDVEGELLPQRDLVFKEATNPPVPVEIKDTWVVRGCRLVSSDGTPATLWTSLQAFLARLETRTAFPTYARLVRDPSGANVEVWKLGGGSAGDGVEGFKIESVELRTDEGIPGATWLTVASVDLRMSCVRRFPVGAGGVVGWSQTVAVSYRDGLRRLEWRTRVTTLEGTSAVDVAKSLAVVPVAQLGGDHAYATNGPDGLDYSTPDADEPNSRTATVCEAVSAVQQFGLATGVTAPGLSPNDFRLDLTTKTTALETVTTLDAEARGPGSLRWVQQQATLIPDADESEIREQRATNGATGTWRKSVARTIADLDLPQIGVVVTGGYNAPSVDFEETVSRRALLFLGPGLPWKCVATITVQKRGFFPKRESLKLPGPLGGKWIFSSLESSESEPERIERGVTPSQDLYQRTATLVFYAVEDPDASSSLVEQFRAATPVVSYLLPIAGNGAVAAAG